MSEDTKMVFNIAYACLTEICKRGQGQRRAYIWVAGSLQTRDYTFEMVEQESGKIASVLCDLGVVSGDVVSIFLPRQPELIGAFFAILKNQAVACILFSTFGETAILDRLQDNRSKIVITKKSLLRKVLNVQDQLADLQYVLVTDADDHISEKVLSLPKLLSMASENFVYPAGLLAETPAFLQYTSGSTGKPKGVVHVHGALETMVHSFEEVMDVREGERYWCTADPAWITGIVYGVIAPFYKTVDQVQFGGTYQAERWLNVLQSFGVNVWYTAPTALRMLMQEEEQLFTRFDYRALERIYCVGEPLNPEIYHWGMRVLGKQIWDTFFQSETGSIMVANRQGMQVRPGSMGKPLSYIEANILDRQCNRLPVGEQGLLCFRVNWGSMFRDYLNKRSLYEEKFIGEYYLTGDLAWRDADGYFWYVGRADDVINTAGHLVGPFEIESALLEVPDIADVAVIGVPDPILHERILAFVCVRKGVSWSKELELNCRVTVSNRVSSVAIPQEFRVVDKIPKNKSGKILRRVLKAWYQGVDPGDLSTMEE